MKFIILFLFFWCRMWWKVVEGDGRWWKGMESVGKKNGGLLVKAFLILNCLFYKVTYCTKATKIFTNCI